MTLTYTVPTQWQTRLNHNVVPDAMQLAYGTQGTPVVYHDVDGKRMLRYATATDRPSDIAGFVTGHERFQDGHPIYRMRPLYTSVSGAQNANILSVDDKPNQHVGAPVHFDLTTNRLTLDESTDTIECGYVRSTQWRYRYDADVGYNNLSYGITCFTRFSTGDNVDLDSTYNVAHDQQSYDYAVGDEVVVVNSTPENVDKVSINVIVNDVNTPQLTDTLVKGAARVYKCTTAPVWSEGTRTTKSIWTPLPNKPPAVANLVIDLATINRADIHGLTATEIANTVGRKQAWTLTSDAPDGTSSGDGGWLTLPTQKSGNAIMVSVHEAVDNERETQIIPLIGEARAYDLLDRDVQISVNSSNQIRVSHLAAGVATFTTRAWLLEV